MALNKWNQITESIIQYKKNNMIYDSRLYEYLVVAEDHRFWKHLGFDLISLLRAIWNTKFLKKREGGSTVAMQLVRTITRDYEPSIRRKISEIYYAFKTTLILRRHNILGHYLSIAYFGWNMHGIHQACSKLGFQINNLTEYEAASLIARLKYPEPRFFSASQKILIRRRAFHIISRHKEMESNNYYGAIFSSQRAKEVNIPIS